MTAPNGIDPEAYSFIRGALWGLIIAAPFWLTVALLVILAVP